MDTLSDDNVMQLDTEEPEATLVRGHKHCSRSVHASIDTGSSQNSAPLSKQFRMRDGTAGTPHVGGSAGGKYINADLPPGCQEGNLWHGTFIPTLAHCCGGSVDPFTIKVADLRDAMQSIWDEVYGDNIEHDIETTGAVFHVAKQRLNEWCGRFAATAIMVLANFFIQNTDFHYVNIRMEFAAAMLEKNCFLFSENSSVDHKVWLGMWRGSLVVQTFASHFNFVSGHIKIPELDSENISPWAALTLAVTAKHAVVIKAETGMTWEVIIPDSKAYGFNVQIWGKILKKFLVPIIVLTDENFMKVIREMQQYVKPTAKGKEKVLGSALSSEMAGDNDFEDLFEFH
ncbi:hypothetical protein PAXRUDRAFT_17496 [Paxillus rubicundulus Ve08.2h10]|uniref:Uncharacterized protein n=1 Tax=Paxillus rubicundulus Ve08.2h10 TaxID=930991 RepID=A0A0D0DHG2_9AGAM|nr:hypothetical protein PAXRUDRAFT_17496 [Paxillus rubicundulus Ve08.2h10]